MKLLLQTLSPIIKLINSAFSWLWKKLTSSNPPPLTVNASGQSSVAGVVGQVGGGSTISVNQEITTPRDVNALTQEDMDILNDLTDVCNNSGGTVSGCQVAKDSPKIRNFRRLAAHDLLVELPGNFFVLKSHINPPLLRKLTI